MTAPALPGIHHITAIAGDPQQNLDFYMGLLGLRLVKRTVNFDDPGSYHLYYGDDLGRPSTIMTFFAWPGAPRGRVGAGQVGATSFSVSASSLDFWRDRLAAGGVEIREEPERFGERVLGFDDPDGMHLELIGVSDDPRPGWADGPVPAEHAVKGFHAPTLTVRDPVPSHHVLADVMQFRQIAQEGVRTRFAGVDNRPGNIVDVVVHPDGRPGYQAVGTVHHIAWRTPDDRQELEWQALLSQDGLMVTEQRDRQYFHSIYYREPGGILYEIATDVPGFAVDEPADQLGTTLKLPPWIESRREHIEQLLPSLRLPSTQASSR